MRSALLAIGLATLAAAAAPAAEPPKADYRATGVVVSLFPPPSEHHATRPVIVIHHDPVPGLMDESMDMPFIAASADLFRGLRPGDRIRFDLKETPDALLVITIQRVRER
ncbi:MAG: copper-binding protein [Candidatus Rokubacteria bacterium]|nr:copper-binding protein [Candidatus Rokubacteria bacterium]MBI3825059.1 copper-binding protein [Candidatus Rokubacteria bacterium]